MASVDYFNSVAGQYEQSSRNFFWSRMRAREANVVMRALWPSNSYQDVLELGCGAGFYTRRILSWGPKHLTVIEESSEMTKQLGGNPKLNIIVGDFSRLAIPGKFDLVFCAGALEFNNDLEVIFKNIAGALKPRGDFVLLYPQTGIWAQIYRLFHKFHRVDVFLNSKKTLIELAQRNRLDLTFAAAVFPLAMVYKFQKRAL